MRLHTRIVLLIFAIVTLLSASLSLLSTRVVQAVMEDGIESNATLLSRMLADHIADSMVRDKPLAVRGIIRDAAGQMEDVAYIYVVDSRGGLYAHTFEGGFPRALAARLNEPVQGLSPRLTRFSTADGPLLEVTSPLIGGMQARIHIGIDQTSMFKRIRRTQGLILSLAFGIAVIGGVTGLLTSRRFARPLGQMAEYMQDFGSGKSRGEIALPTGSRDIADMVQAFNRMVTGRQTLEASMQQRTQELAGLNELGRRVSASLSVKQVIEATLEEVVRSVSPDIAFLFLREGESLVLQGSAPAGSEFLHDETPVHCVGECLCGIAAGERKPVYSGDILTDARCTWSECKEAGLRSYAALPLHGGSEVVGVLGLGSVQIRDFAAQDTFLEALSIEISIALRNALLHEQVQSHAAELEDRVAKRTADLAIAKNRAEESDRLKSAFLATMSHELRTPLNSVIGFTGILLQGLAGPFNEEQAKQLGMVKNSARHLLELINDVLDISKIEAGQLEVVPEQFDMPETVMAVVNGVGPLAEGKGLTLLVDVSSHVGAVFSDKRRVEQILLNLLNNAIKFTDKGEVRIECEAVRGQIVTRISDTGIGIRPEDLPGVFEPFRQVDTGLDRRHEGTGLGLAICRKLAGALGGGIEVESKLGVGSTFALTIPERRQETGE